MKTKPHFNPAFGKWKTAPYGRNPNEKTTMEKVLEVWKALRRRLPSVRSLRQKPNQIKKAKGQRR